MLQLLAAFAARHRADAHAAFIAYIGRHSMVLQNVGLNVESMKRN
jgi:hypothetical protein